MICPARCRGIRNCGRTAQPGSWPSHRAIRGGFIWRNRFGIRVLRDHYLIIFKFCIIIYRHIHRCFSQTGLRRQPVQDDITVGLAPYALGLGFDALAVDYHIIDIKSAEAGAAVLVMSA